MKYLATSLLISLMCAQISAQHYEPNSIINNSIEIWKKIELTPDTNPITPRITLNQKDAPTTSRAQRNDSNIYNHAFHGELIYGAKWGILNDAEAIIYSNVNVNHRDELGKTALNWAVFHGHAESVYELIRANANVNIPDKKGITPLHNSIMRNRPGLVQFLIEEGADVNAQDCSKRTPLHWLTRLCKRAPKKELHQLSKQRIAEFAATLLQAQPNTNLRDKHGKTALAWAHTNGQDELIKLIHDYDQTKNEYAQS